MSKSTLKRGHILGLRTNAQNLRSHGGFQWPESGKVNAPDWSPAAECGNGLHFLKWGDGDVNLLHSPYDQKTKWLVISTPEKGAVDLNGKSKCEECEVVYCGEKQGAIDLLVAHAPAGTKIAYSTVTAGDGGTATAGDEGTATAGTRGTATAGYGGTATAGYGGTATAGTRGTATAGDEGTATAGDGGTATARDEGTATAGTRGTATAGDEGTATAGYGGTATAGTRGTATAGYGGTATAGDEGTATAGYGGVITIAYYDNEKVKYRRLIGHVVDGGLKPNVAYRINDQCQFEEVPV